MYDEPPLVVSGSYTTSNVSFTTVNSILNIGAIDATTAIRVSYITLAHRTNAPLVGLIVVALLSSIALTEFGSLSISDTGSAADHIEFPAPGVLLNMGNQILVAHFASMPMQRFRVTVGYYLDRIVF